MTRPIRWTDTELRAAGNAADKTYWMDNWSLSWMRAFLAALGAVHPAEARDREREAWDAALDWLNQRSTHFPCSSVAPVACSERDERYPSLLPQSPPPLVLSGTRWRRIEVGCYRGKWDRLDIDSQTACNFPDIRTASDAEKLAAWLRQYGSDDERR